MSKKQSFLETWLVCPNTGHQKPGEQVTSYAIPGGWALWWRCSTCHRWHMVEKLAPPKKVSPALTRKVSSEAVRHQEVKA
jgi:hypothetical protein